MENWVLKEGPYSLLSAVTLRYSEELRHEQSREVNTNTVRSTATRLYTYTCILYTYDSGTKFLSCMGWYQRSTNICRILVTMNATVRKRCDLIGGQAKYKIKTDPRIGTTNEVSGPSRHGALLALSTCQEFSGGPGVRRRVAPSDT